MTRGAQEHPYTDQHYCAACGDVREHRRWNTAAKWCCGTCGRACTEAETGRVSRRLDAMGIPGKRTADDD